MARADRRRAQREARHAGSRGTRRARGGSRTTSARVVEQTLFFTRLRRRAKWAFAVMVVVFAVGFAFLGVGSGGLDLQTLVQDVFGAGGGSGTSLSKAQKETQKHPMDPKAWKSLADALQSHGRRADEIVALEHYVKLRPNDLTQLQRLAQIEVQDATDAQSAEAAAATKQQQISTGSLFSSSLLGADPLTSAAQSAVSSEAQSAILAYESSVTRAMKTLQTLAVKSNDVSSYTELATSAEQFRQNSVAIAAYKKLLKLEPDPGTRAQVRARLKLLRAGRG